MRAIETDTFTDQDLSSALEIGSYTADAARALKIRVFADQVAGDGDYVIWATIQLAGTGSTYRLIPITTAAAAFISDLIPVASGDVVKVWLTGQAGDTTTPDTRVEWWEDDSLRPAEADRALAVDGSGQVIVGGYAAGQEPAQQVWEYGTRTLSSFGSLAADAATAVWGATTRTLTAISDSAGVTTLLSRLSAAWAALLDVAVSSVGSPAGTGDNPVTITVVNAADDAPIAGLTVTAWNSAITARLAYGTTDSNGQVKFNLAAGDIKIAIGTTPSWVAHDAVSYTVTGDGAQDVPTIELTAQSVTPPASASTVVGVLDVYDENGDLTSGITISAQMIRAPGAAGQSHESTVFTGTSNASGRVEMTFTRGAQYRIWRGTGERAIFTAPATGNSFSLPEILGTP